MTTQDNTAPRKLYNTFHPTLDTSDEITRGREHLRPDHSSPSN